MERAVKLFTSLDFFPKVVDDIKVKTTSSGIGNSYF